METTINLNLTLNLYWVIGIGAYILINLLIMLWVNSGKRYDLSGTLFILATALPLAIVVKLHSIFTDTLQIKFFWSYYILRKDVFHKADIGHLYQWNRASKVEFNTNSLHDKIYRLSCQIVNKKNGYLYNKDISKTQKDVASRMDLLETTYSELIKNTEFQKNVITVCNQRKDYSH